MAEESRNIQGPVGEHRGSLWAGGGVAPKGRVLDTRSESRERTRMLAVPAMLHILEFPAQDINMHKHETRIGIVCTAT